ncbi:regulatory protein, luxR family [Actinokineospora alba]|uniref:Regulatory protein, luxR family n=1 Tax=Actinokineospora alba TaxID=504798 RepID=A0A1H0T4F2_9PSEU|nr:helix-turn-helix transcriptional regulator [Actinokineospora alba]TDP66390.1 regulatory LuxR family protein [Actinokineospora alba]SDJ23795.1 regulatory protein, luxR family [Actinokineospora alba]SDP48428.1 regulatory protein, luxR family [Actinokineospora alba]
MGVVDDLARARAAFEHREWMAAYEALSEADDAVLTADDFAQLATAAYLVGRTNDCVQAMQRAYQGHVDAGDTLGAARCGFWLSMVLLMSGEPAVAGGWGSRCQRLLDDVPGDVVERGYLLMLAMLRSFFTGDHETAHRLALEVIDYGHRYRDADLLANGLNAQGRLLLYAGRVPEGLALLDEAMIGISTGEVSPVSAGQVYCSMIEACQEVSDYGRAAEWTSVLTTWIDAQPGLVKFTGQCAVHRGQIMRVRGAFTEAVEEFELAAHRYAAAETPGAAGLALAECGDVLRVRGDFAAAEAAYARAAGYGYEPQPGLALLWSARGRGQAAVAAVSRLLGEQRGPVHRSRLLPGAVEVLLAGGDTDQADELSVELAAIAGSFGCPALRAMAGYARGGVLLARGEPAAALPESRIAAQEWQRLSSPYELARCRVLIGRALRELADEQSATTEFAAARQVFHDLGALPAEQEAAHLVAPAAPGGLTAREVEVLRLVAAGRSNPEIAARLVLSEKTVARHLSNIFTKLDVTSRTAAAAFAYENRLV